MRLAPLMMLCAALSAAAPLPAARIEPAPLLQPSTHLPEGNGPWVVRAHFDSDRSLALLLRRAAPWRVDRKAGVLIIEVDNRFEYQRLLDEGFRVAVDPDLTQAVYAPVAVSPEQITGIPGYACYRTV
ncbi:MAG: hypothetical protein JNL89_10915, partial [Rhodanobacteraceae bacterium]|nr:hypothetical protein [Rhodanobacteraceae bacterium]